MHPEKYNCDSNRFTLKMFSCIFPGRAWHALHSTSCPTRFGPESSLKPREREGALSGVRTMDGGLSMSRRNEFLCPCPRSRHIHCWRSRYSLPCSTHTKGGREIFKIFEERNMPTHVLLLLQTRLRSENGARSKGGKKGGDISSLISVLNISYPSRGLSTTTVWFLTVTEIESYGRCAIRRCFRTFHIA